MKEDPHISPDEPEADPALWSLLGQARPPTARPDFVAAVLRATEPPRSPRRSVGAFGPWSVISWLVAGWRRGGELLSWPPAALLGSAVAVIALVWVGTFHDAGRLPAPRSFDPAARPASFPAVTGGSDAVPSVVGGTRAGDTVPPLTGDNAGLPLTEAGGQDALIITDLDVILNSNENHLWLDDDAAS